MGKWQRLLPACLLLILLIVAGKGSALAVPDPYSIQWLAPPNQFVVSLYNGVLGRNPQTEADRQTVIARARLLANGQTTRLQLFWVFINSDEYQASPWAKQQKEYNIYLNQIKVELPSGGWDFCNCYFFAKFAHATEFITILNLSPLTYGEAAALMEYSALNDPDACTPYNCRGGGGMGPGNLSNPGGPAGNPPGSGPDPMMPPGGCTCEDWDSNGQYGVVLSGNVLRSNIGSYETCMNYAATLSQCGGQGPTDEITSDSEYLDSISADKFLDELLSSPVVEPGQQVGIVAKIIKMHECKYGSGGNPKTRSHYSCKVEFSLENTSDTSIAFSSGFMETEHDWDGTIKRERVGYTHDLHPGKTMKLNGRCTIPHDAASGNWQAWGTGYHRGNPNKEQFSWSIGLGCRK